MANLSYFVQLCDELKETTKMGDTPLEPNHKVVLTATTPECAASGGGQPAAILGRASWKAAGCSQPDLLYAGNGKLTLYFRDPKTASTNTLVSAASSIVTAAYATTHSREGQQKPYVCVCTAAQMADRPRIFAHFVLEIGAHFRKAVARAASTAVDHLTETELQAVRASALGEERDAASEQFRAEHGVFYRASDPTAGFAMALAFPDYEDQAKVLFGA